EAKTSAFAPCSSWVRSAVEAPKLNLTVTPGLACVKAGPISPNASVSDDAANTVRSPRSAGVALGVGGALVTDGAAAVIAGAGVATRTDEALLESLPQASASAASNREQTSATRARMDGCLRCAEPGTTELIMRVLAM